MQEIDQGLRGRVTLGKTGESRKGQKVVDVAAEPLGELRCPRQPDQRDARVGSPCTQRSQRGHGTKQIAELQRPKDRNALRPAKPWRGINRHAVLPQATKAPKRIAPTRRQNTASGGMRMDVATISAIWTGWRDVPRSRRQQNAAVETSQINAEAAASGFQPASNAATATTSESTLA